MEKQTDHVARIKWTDICIYTRTWPFVTSFLGKGLDCTNAMFVWISKAWNVKIYQCSWTVLAHLRRKLVYWLWRSWPTYTYAYILAPVCMCGEGGYLCEDSDLCLDRTKVCDGNEDCRKWKSRFIPCTIFKVFGEKGYRYLLLTTYFTCNPTHFVRFERTEKQDFFVYDKRKARKNRTAY